MTTVATAIKNWEVKSGEKAVDAKAVKLYAQIPPIQKLDNSLNQLVCCEQLSLSTNSIDRLVSLAGMKKLEILSVGRNRLSKIEKLDDNRDTLKQIWASYNFISSLDGLTGLKNLEILYLSNNKISKWEEISKLNACTKLKDVLLVGNPIYEGLSEHDRRIKVLQCLKDHPSLSKIDNEIIKPSEREAAASAGA